MNWRNDPRIQKLLEKATLECLFKCYFQRIYGTEEMAEMENALKDALAKYNEGDALYEKLLESDENVVEPLANECLDTLCEETLSRGKNHSPETLLTLAKLLITVGDNRLACEVIWCSASLAIQTFIVDHQLKVKLYSQNGKRGFARALSRDIGRRFSVFEMCHWSFYKNGHNARNVNAAFEDATEFIQKLRELQITDELKMELEKENFNI